MKVRDLKRWILTDRKKPFFLKGCHSDKWELKEFAPNNKFKIEFETWDAIVWNAHTFQRKKYGLIEEEEKL